MDNDHDPDGEAVAYAAASYAQDASTGRVGVILDGIAATAAAAGAFSHVDAAVAYATAGGVRVLLERLAPYPSWSTASKRWLVSFDFGITEPKAVEALAAQAQSEVRVPNGQQVLGSKLLRPWYTFHTKGYLFRGPSWATPSGLILGSANLSVSALATGAEAAVSQSWTGRLHASDRDHLTSAYPFLDWFEDAWDAADPLATVLPAYVTLRRTRRLPRNPPEDRTPVARAAALTSAGNEVHGALAAQLAAARALWVETGHLYINMPQRGVGNQLDTPRGTRVFFGFGAQSVARNHVFGDIELQIPGYSAVTRSVRYGNNQMDKVNLPVPGSAGPGSYDNSVLIFERDGATAGGLQRFRLTVTNGSGLKRRQARARNSIALQMQGGRSYGLLF